jgi:hypothetical protein
MPPKTKNLVADHLLKAIYKTHGYDHNSHADAGSADGKPDDEPRKCLLPVKGYSFCYEDRNIQTAYFCYLTNVFYLTVMIRITWEKLKQAM